MILAKFPVFYHEHYDFVGLVVWHFSLILPLSYAGLRFFFAARWYAVVGFKFTFTIVYVGLVLWTFDACVFSHCAVLSWSKLPVCVLWFVVQHGFLIALLRYGSLFLFLKKKCKHILFVDMMIYLLHSTVRNVGTTSTSQWRFWDWTRAAYFNVKGTQCFSSGDIWRGKFSTKLSFIGLIFVLFVFFLL